MSHRLKVTIKNDSDYALIVADDAPETVLKAPSVLATGSNPLPQSVAPRTESSFTIATPISGPTPEGSIALRFDTLQLSAHLSWKNFIANSSNGASPPPDPCSWAEERLEGGAGDLNATIEYFDGKGGTIERSTLADPYPYLAGGAESDTLADANRLIGWLDLDAFATPFLSRDFDKPLAPSLLLKPELVCQQANRYSQKPCVTEADFRLIGAWINAMLGLENELARWVAHIKAPATHLAPAAPEPFPLYLSAGSRYLPV